MLVCIAIQSRRNQGPVEGLSDIVCLHCRAQLPGDDVTREVIKYG